MDDQLLLHIQKRGIIHHIPEQGVTIGGYWYQNAWWAIKKVDGAVVGKMQFATADKLEAKLSTFAPIDDYVPCWTRDQIHSVTRKWFGALRDIQTITRAVIGGSIRRKISGGKPIPPPHDVEIIAEFTPEFMGWLDNGLKIGLFEKAKFGKTGVTKWGQSNRGIAFPFPDMDYTLRFDLFAATSLNWGYIKWLRTGPNKTGNLSTQYLVTQLKNSPYLLATNIYLRDTVPIVKGEPKPDKKSHIVKIPTEQAWFELCGIPYHEPHERTEQLYRNYFSLPDHQWGDPSKFTIIKQQELL